MKTEIIAVVKRLYKQSTEHRINEYYIEGKGWIEASLPLNKTSLTRLAKIGVETVNIRLVDEWGAVRLADYKMSEFTF